MRNIIIAVCVVLTVIGLGIANAQSDCATSPCIYLPVILRPENTPTVTLQPTVAPTPTATTTPIRKVVVVSSNAFVPYEGATDLYLVGEVRNDTTSNVWSVKINAVLRNGAGQIVDGDYSYGFIDKLTPGMTSAFLIIFSSPPTWATYELTVTWSTTDQSPYALEILNPEAYFDSSDAYHVRGTVRNQYTVQRTFVQVFLTMYDSNNQVIGTDHTYTNPTTLEPGQEVPFDIDAYFWKYKPDRSKIARYTIQAYDD